MSQRFAPWDDAINRQLLTSIKNIMRDHLKKDPDSDYFYAQDALDEIENQITETEGPDWMDQSDDPHDRSHA
jgi:hypothetical protein